MRLWILIFVAVAFCLTFAAYGLTAPMEGLVLYLTFDEGQGDTAEDLSGEGNDGFFVGDPKWVKGKFGMALQFSREENKNHVEVPDDPSLNPETEVSCAAWIYPTNFDTTGGIVVKYSEAAQRSYYLGLANSTSLSIESACSSDGTFAAGKAKNTIAPANSIELDKWQHVAMTFKAKEFHRLYVNGELVVENKDIAFDHLFDNTVPVLVGQYMNSYEFTGIIDEVVIFDRVISDAEVKDVMEGQLKIIAVDPCGKLTSAWGEIKKL